MVGMVNNADVGSGDVVGVAGIDWIGEGGAVVRSTAIGIGGSVVSTASEVADVDDGSGTVGAASEVGVQPWAWGVSPCDRCSP